MKRIGIAVGIGLMLVAMAAIQTSRASAQQPVVTDENLDQMIASAQTPADHDAIAAFFEKEAADAKQKAALHKNAADTYRKLKIAKPVYMANMCDGIAAGFEKTAADAEKLAKMHHEMAKAAETKR